MMRRFVEMMSGNFHYRALATPVRSSDSVARAAPDVLCFGTSEVDGAGTSVGAWGRTNPYVLNAVQNSVTHDISGVGVSSKSGAMAGHLLDPVYLAKKLGLG